MGLVLLPVVHPFADDTMVGVSVPLGLISYGVDDAYFYIKARPNRAEPAHAQAKPSDCATACIPDDVLLGSVTPNGIC